MFYSLPTTVIRGRLENGAVKRNRRNPEVGRRPGALGDAVPALMPGTAPRRAPTPYVGRVVASQLSLMFRTGQVRASSSTRYFLPPVLPPPSPTLEH